MERLSKYAFALEAALLAYPTFLGLILVAGSLLPVLTGAQTRGHIIDAAVSVVVLVGLICGWRLALTFLFSGRLKTREVRALWWVAASGVAVASALVAVYARLVTHNASWAESSFGILEYGILFVPSFVHLSSEGWLRAV